MQPWSPFPLGYWSFQGLLGLHISLSYELLQMSSHIYAAALLLEKENIAHKETSSRVPPTGPWAGHP